LGHQELIDNITKEINMALTLEKKEPLSLEKVAPALKRLEVEAIWVTPKTNVKFDVDLSAFVCEYRADKTGQVVPQVITQEHTCFHANPITADGALENTTGDALGEDGTGREVIVVTIDKLDPRAKYVPFILTIDKAAQRHQSFGMVKSGGVNIRDLDSGELLGEFVWGTGAYTDETAIHLATLERDENGAFTFTREDSAGVKSLSEIGSQDYGF
jgi:stress response protein SCP2